MVEPAKMNRVRMKRMVNIELVECVGALLLRRWWWEGVMVMVACCTEEAAGKREVRVEG